jgi:F-type H+-transporting ATPase subunit b
LELNWTTFVLEIINFLVLVWILKRFLYRPVLAAIRQRQEKIEQKLDEAAKLKTEGTDLQQQYEGRLQEWDREKQQAQDTLQQEIQAERIKKIEQLKNDLASEREKVAVIDERHRVEAEEQYQQIAHAQGARFAARLLSAAAGPELELRLFDLMLQTFDQLDEEQLSTLRDNCKSSANKVSVISAFPLSQVQKKQLRDKLSELSKQAVDLDYTQDPALIAGLRLIIGAWVLHLNIQDDLKDFSGLSHEIPVN